MCKRFSFKSTTEEVEQQFGVSVTNTLRWSYNVASTQHAYVILNENPSKIQYVTWGLIPSTSRDGKNEGKLITARREGIAVSSSFRIPIRSKRCLVLADSFYEWKKLGSREIPHRIVFEDNTLMAFAGIWDIWYKGNYAVKSFSIITQPATGRLRDIMSRMPVIIQDKRDQSDWLEDIPLFKVQTIMERNYNSEKLKYYPITTELHSIQKNDSSLHLPA